MLHVAGPKTTRRSTATLDRERERESGGASITLPHPRELSLEVPLSVPLAPHDAYGLNLCRIGRTISLLCPLLLRHPLCTCLSVLLLSKCCRGCCSSHSCLPLFGWENTPIYILTNGRFASDSSSWTFSTSLPFVSCTPSPSRIGQWAATCRCIRGFFWQMAHRCGWPESACRAHIDQWRATPLPKPSTLCDASEASTRPRCYPRTREPCDSQYVVLGQGRPSEQPPLQLA